MEVNIKPLSPNGEVFAISSKSDAHRAIISASLADRDTKISISHTSKDIEATLGCIKSIGADYRKTGIVYEISPVKNPVKNPTLDCFESGSTLRFLLPVLGCLGSGATFIGSGRLPERPMEIIVDLLKEHGNSFSSSMLPITISGKLLSGTYKIRGDVSSQYISGLLFALPLLDDESKIILTSKLESSAYVDLTIDILKKFGTKIIREGNEFLVNPIGRYKSPGEYIVEGDWSNSAFFLVMGALGGNVTVKNLDLYSRQSDKMILDVLKLSGADVTISEDSVSVSKSKIKPFDFDVSECPDLFPIISILAAGAEGKSTLYNAKRLRIKESDRIKSTRELIENLGGKATETEDSLTIWGTGKLKGGIADSANDHRIAMSAFSASVICENDVLLKNAESINKSYPTFMEDFKRIGGHTDVI